MKRRGFLKGLAATGVFTMLDQRYLEAKERLRTGKPPSRTVPRRRFGRTTTELSIIGFGGIVVKDVTPGQAARYVGEAVDRGINYFDVAPTYGNAEERLGPALDLAQSGALIPLNDEERKLLREIAEKSDPIFSREK